jgi:hypothetical protein
VSAAGSQFFDDIRSAAAAGRIGKSWPIWHAAPAARSLYRRGTLCALLELFTPLRANACFIGVSGEHPNGAKFAEQASTLIVNAYGGLIALKETVLPGQRLSVKSESTGEEILCTIVSVESGSNEAFEVGIEFVRPDPKFWRITLPPADWSPRSPEAKRFGKDPKPAATNNPPANK